MLNKWNFKVAEFVGSKHFNAIHITPQATMATNAHYLMWVSTPPDKAADFPVIEHAPKPEDTFPPFLLSLDDAKRIEKALPRKTTIPVLECAGVAVRDDKPIIEVTDLACPQVFRPAKVEGQFPNCDAVWPTEEPRISIALNAGYLKKIAAFMADFNPSANHTVILSLYGEEKCVRFDAYNEAKEQGASALLMPLLVKGDVRHTYGWQEREAAREALAAKRAAKAGAEAAADAGVQEETAESVAAVDESASTNPE